MRACALHPLWLALALGCATGGSSSADDAASFGPGGNSNPTQSTGGSGSLDSGTDGNTDSNSNSNSATGNSNSGSADDTGPENPDCVDEDGDDYGTDCVAGEDCDDDDPEINPGAPELCDGIDQNCDEMGDDGCECPDDGVSSNCNAPTDLGTLMVAGDNVIGVVGNVAQEGGIEWYTVSYPAAARPGEGTPTLQFAINEDDAFVFDVVTGQCDAAGQTCTTGGTGGTAVGLTTWSFVDDDPGCCTPPSDAMVAWPNQLFVRVYRTSMGSSCAAYQLQATR
jgi:Putative metal-binding motif